MSADCKQTCSQENPCAAVQLLAQKVGILEGIVEKLQNNLPPYVTAIAALGGVLIGVLGTLVGVFASK